MTGNEEQIFENDENMKYMTSYIPKLFLIDGAAGTGKSDLLNYIKNRRNISVVKKYTTREKREKEETGETIDLEFISKESYNKYHSDPQYYYTYIYNKEGYSFRKRRAY